MDIFIVGVFHNRSTNYYMAKAFRKLGHKVLEFSYRDIMTQYSEDEMRDILIKEVMVTKPQLVIFCKAHNVGFEAAQTISSVTKTWEFYPDPVENPATDAIIKMSKGCNFISCVSNGIVEYFKHKGIESARYIPEGVDTDIFYPNYSIDPKYIADISFIGTRDSVRDLFVAFLQYQYKELNIKCYGDGWDNAPVYNEEFSKVCTASKIMLGINRGADSYSDRALLTLASSGFYLVNYTTGFENYFDIGSHLVTYTSWESLSGAVRYYLNDEQSRRRIALAGHRFVVDYYTWVHTCRKILEVVDGTT